MARAANRMPNERRQHRHPVEKYFFEARCACDPIVSTPFPQSLCLTALTFIFPAALLLSKESFVCRVLGALAVTLTTTSLWYHATHHPWARACDVSTILVTAVLGLGAANVSLVQDGANAYLVAAHGTLVIIMMISYSSAFHFVNAKGDGIIVLPWHMVMHLLTTATITFIAIGLPWA